MLSKSIKLTALSGLIIFSACENKQAEEKTETAVKSKYEVLNDKYTTVKLTTDLSQLSEKQKLMIPKLIEIAKIMDGLFWKEAFGDKSALLDTISNPLAKRFTEINYGPWDRLDGNKPFISGFGEKPAGATYYPQDMTKEE
ncbi:MAG: Zn-dependent hydrolase, partial [Fulvivirga sp.]